MKPKPLVLIILIILNVSLLTTNSKATTKIYKLEGEQTNNISTQNYTIYTEPTILYGTYQKKKRVYCEVVNKK